MTCYWRGMDVLGARPSAIVAALAPPPEPDDIYDAGDAADYDSAFLAARSLAVFGASSKAWDNMSSFNSGDIVYYSGKYYRALKDISPPFLPSVQSGDVPGSSDSWRQVSASASGDVLGVNSWEWDNRKSYKTGDVVSYWGSYWRAARAISPPMFPSIQSGEVPGDSDAWSAGVSSADVLGTFDIGAKQLQMNGLKQVTIGVAKALLDGGQHAIDFARMMAAMDNLPGGTDRDNVYWKLQWHKAAIDKLTPKLNALPDTVKAQAQAGGNVPYPEEANAIYPSGSDLEHWVMQAFIESNAAEEGAKTVDAMTTSQMWTDMWYVVGKELAKLPAEVKKLINQAGNAILDSIPTWAKVVGGVAAAGAVGAVGYWAWLWVKPPTRRI